MNLVHLLRSRTKEKEAIRLIKKNCRTDWGTLNYHRGNDVLVTFLEHLGYSKLVAEYKKIRTSEIK